MGRSFILKASDGTQVTEYSLNEGTTSIGRSADNLLVLDDTQISRHHAQVEYDGSTARITDLGSSNGTTVNGNKIEPNVPHELKEGDSIGMGSHSFTVGELAPAAAAVAATPEKASAPADIPAATVKKQRMSGKTLGGIIAGAVVVATVVTLLMMPGVIRSLLIERTAHVEIDSGGLEDLFEGLNIGTGTDKDSPKIVSFISDSQTIEPGDKTELVWTVSDATEVTIEPGVGSFTGSGSAEVSPDSTQTYILTATNEHGSVTRSITVEIASEETPSSSSLPVINTFNASATSIDEGDSTVLEWDVSEADTVSIDPGAPSVPASGSATSSPPDTTTYTLTATNEAGSVEKTVTVTVTAAAAPPPPASVPSIISFGANPSSVSAGSNSILMWDVYGATSIYIDNGIGQIPFSTGYIVVSPFASTTYTLTATNSAGTVSDSATITVSAASLPVVNNFSASPTSIGAGGTSTLSWNVSGASSVNIVPGGGAVPSSGSATVSPGTTTTFTLTATSAAGSVTRQVTVTVAAAPSLPVIASFTASPTSISSGASSTLSWSTSGATSVSISPGGVVSASGSATASPGSTTTYTLTATNSAGSATRQVTVTVAAAPSLPVINSFTASPTSISAGGISTLSWSISGATSASISPGGGIGASGSATVNPGSTTTYTLTATNSAGSATRQVTVTVAAAPPPSGDSATCEQTLFNAVNAKRSAAGVAALTRNSYIDNLCRQHAQYMASAGTLSHDNFSTRSSQIIANVPGMMQTAENVLYNFLPCDAAAMAQQWFDSPGHHDNMLNPAYTISGMGIYIDGSGKIWACQIFAGP